jgi:hypothetical protein
MPSKPIRQRLLVLVSLSLLILSASQASAQLCGVHCGTERWKVKSLTGTTINLPDTDPVTKFINGDVFVSHEPR